MDHIGRRVAILALLVAITVAPVLPAFAQGGTEEPELPNPDASISWPPPVYVLSGPFAIRGSANLPNMTYYFVEVRPLDDPFTGAEADDSFVPVVLPTRTPVQDGVLGIWDTEAMPDGLYELRLTVNVRGSAPIHVVVSPLRIENEPSPFATVTPTFTFLSPTPPPSPTPLPTLTPIPPTPTPVPPTPIPPTTDPTPRATVTSTRGNVRTGDSTLYPIMITLTQGQTVQVIGISNTGTGWYQVLLSNGLVGWMAPSIVSLSGNFSLVPYVSPPPPPATPTPPPSPTPLTTANLVAGIVEFSPLAPTCAETFTVGFDVANLGSEATASSGTVTLVDTHTADGAVQGTTIGGFPVLTPGQTFRVNMPLTISTWYNETHTITLTIDQQNLIPETQTDDNVRVVEYVLAMGSCP